MNEKSSRDPVETRFELRRMQEEIAAEAEEKPPDMLGQTGILELIRSRKQRADEGGH